MLLDEIKKCRGTDAALDSYVQALENSLQRLLGSGGTDIQAHARNIADRLAVAMQASVLVRFGDEKVRKFYLLKG